MSSKSDRAKHLNTLTCLLKGLEGRVTTIELRNESSIRGCIKSVDSSMNTHLSSAVYVTPDGKKSRLFDQFFVQGKNIRYVHIPDDMDIMSTIHEQIASLTRIGCYTERARKLTSLERKDLKKQQRKDKVNNAVEEMKTLLKLK